MKKKFFVPEAGVHDAVACPIEVVNDALLDVKTCHREMIVRIAVMQKRDF